jgi:predicted RNase H-like HicB family nuclease
MRVAVVKAAHDDDAGVWYVEHSDVEGLHVEGETFEAFCKNIAAAAADLIEEKGDGEIQIEIIAHAPVRPRLAA